MKIQHNRWRIITVLLLFDAIWALAVFGQMHTLYWQAGLIVILAVLSPSSWQIASIIALTGIALDVILIQLDILSLSGQPAFMPAYLILLWFGFGFCLATCQNQLPRRWPQMALLGALLGIMGYLFAHLFNALSLGPSLPAGIAIIGLCWAVLFSLGSILLNSKSAT